MTPIQILTIMGAGWGILGITCRLHRLREPDALRLPAVALLAALIAPLLEGVVSLAGLADRPLFRALFTVKSYPFLYGPLLWFYTRSVMGLRTPRMALHLLPFLVWGGVALGGLLPYPGPGRFPGTLHQLHGITNAVSLLTYGILILRLLAGHRRHLEDRFADRGIYTSLNWLWRITAAYLVLFTGAVLFILFHRHLGLSRFVRPPQIHILTIAAWIFYLMLHLHRQQQLDHGSAPERNRPGTEEARYANSGLDTKQLEEIAIRLQHYLEESAAYLDPDLTLVRLAELSGIPRHHISQALNTIRQENFYTCINRLRLERFERNIRENRFPGHSLLGQAMECGFKSSSSFYSTIRQQRGVSPGELAAIIRDH